MGIVSVIVLNVNEEPSSPSYSYCIKENSEFAYMGGSLKNGFIHKNDIDWKKCGSTNEKLISSDPDAGDQQQLEYSLLSVVPAYDVGSSGFFIDQFTGQVYLECSNSDESCIDYERQQNYSLTVQTQDPGKLRQTSTIFVQVVDVNEAPLAVLPEGEEFITCGGTYAGPQLADVGGVQMGMSKGTCIGCPMLFMDVDFSDEPTSFQCGLQSEDGSCADIYDGMSTGFIITESGDICATENIDAAFTATLSQRRRRLRREGRRLAVDDVTVCYNVSVTDSGAQQSGDKITSNQTVVCVTIKDQNYAPNVTKNQTFEVSESALPGTRVGKVDAHDIDTVNSIADTLTYSIVQNVSGTTPKWAGNVFNIDPQTGWISVVSNSDVDECMGGEGDCTLVEKDDSSQGLVPSTTLNYEQIGKFTLAISVRDDGGCKGRQARDTSVQCADPLENGLPRCEDCCSAVDKGPFGGECCQWNETKLGKRRPTSMCDPNLAVTRIVQIDINDENEPPRIDEANFAVEENSDSATAVGVYDEVNRDCVRDPETRQCNMKPVTAKDDDEGQTHTFILTSNSEVWCKNCGTPREALYHATDIFSIDEVTGQISLSSYGENVIDYEEKNMWRVEVKATDSGIMSSGPIKSRLSHRRNMSVFIIDVNEVPTMEPMTFYVSEASDPGTFVGALKAFDVDDVYADSPEHLQLQYMFDSTSPIYSLFTEAHGNLGGAFEISPAGNITVSSDRLDFEDINNYTRVVRVIDDGGFNKKILSTTQVVTILVNDTNDAFVDHFLPSHNSDNISLPIEKDEEGVVMLTDGGQQIDIVGRNFGSKHGGMYAINVTYGPQGVESTAEECRITRNYNVITCTTIPGVGKNHRWIVRIKDLVGTSWQAPLLAISPASNEKTRYYAPHILSMLNSKDMSTQGGDVVKFIGTNFGPIGTTITADYGTLKAFPDKSYEGRNCNITALGVECRTSPGVGGDLWWRLKVAGQISNLYGNSSYAAPSVTGVEINSTAGQFFQTTGGESFILYGENFGGDETTYYFNGSVADSKLRVFYGDRAATSRVNEYEATSRKVLSHTQIKCLSVPGKGYGHEIQVTIIGQVSDISATTIRYATPSIMQVSGPGANYASTAGGQLIEFAGKNFGPAGQLDGFVSYGHPRYLEHKSSCTLCSGHGSCSRSNLGNLTDDDCRDVECACVCHTGYTGDDCAVCLNTDDTLCDEGNNRQFLTSSTKNGFDMVHSVHSYNVPMDCRVTTAHTRIRCLSGTGKGHYFVVRVDGQTSNPFFGNNSYAPPVIETYSGPGVNNAATRGGEVVILNGREFGSKAWNKLDWVKYGRVNSDVQFEAKKCSVAVNYIKIKCETAPGAGKDLQWRVSIDGQESVLHTTNYGAPYLKEILGITTMHPNQQEEQVDNVFAHTDGGDIITIVGKNFGPPDLQRSIFVGVKYGPTGSEYDCVEAIVVSHTRITCTMTPGIGDKLHWKVFIHDQNSSVSTFWTAYKPPTITSIQREIPETDDIKFPYNVADGPSANVVATRGGDTVRIWGTDFGILAAVSDVSIVFDAREEQIKWNANENRYSKGRICLDKTARIKDCPHNQTRHFVDFVVPEGQGLEKQIQVCLTDSVRERRLSKKSEINYGIPKVLGVNIFEGKTDASRTLFVRGTNFGSFARLGSVRVSQRRADFLPNPPQMPVRRIGGTREMIDRSCDRHLSNIAEITQNGYKVLPCLHDIKGNCLQYGSAIAVDANAIQGSPVKGSNVDVKANEYMCTQFRSGKSSCKWDSFSKSCVPAWGVLQTVDENNWSHNGIEFQYFGDLIVDPDCIEKPCEYILEGFVEVEVVEVPRNGELPRDGESPSQISTVSYFASYSPQIWSVATVDVNLEEDQSKIKVECNEREENCFSVVGPEYDNENVTNTKYYKKICGDVLTVDMPREVVDLGVSLHNDFCGPCVGSRKCEFMKKDYVSRSCGNSSGLCGVTGNCEGMCDSDRKELYFSTKGGELVTIYGRYMQGSPNRIKVEVIPRDPTPCVGKTGEDLRNCYINVAQPQPRYIKYGTIKSLVEIDKQDKIYKIQFEMPEGSGLYNDLQINRGGQKSNPVFVHYKPPAIHQICYQVCYIWYKFDVEIRASSKLQTQQQGEYIDNLRKQNLLGGTTGDVYALSTDAARKSALKQYVRDNIPEYRKFNDFDILVEIKVEGQTVNFEVDLQIPKLNAHAFKKQFKSIFAGEDTLNQKDISAQLLTLVGIGALGSSRQLSVDEISDVGFIEKISANSASCDKAPFMLSCMKEKDNDDRFLPVPMRTVGGKIEIWGQELGSYRTGNGLRSYTSRIWTTSRLAHGVGCEWGVASKSSDMFSLAQNVSGKLTNFRGDVAHYERLVCVIESSQGDGHEVQLEIAGQRSNKFVISYNPPSDIVINVTSANPVPTDNKAYHSVLKITGKNFGVVPRLNDNPDWNLKVKIGLHFCTQTFSELLYEEEHRFGETESSEAVIYCNIPSGQGIKALSVIVSNQNASVPFYYQAPEVNDVYLLSGNRTGRTDGYMCEPGIDCAGRKKELLVIVGRNFGVDGLKFNPMTDQINAALSILSVDDNGIVTVLHNVGSLLDPKYIIADIDNLNGVSLMDLVNMNRIAFITHSVIYVDGIQYNYQNQNGAIIPDTLLIQFGPSLTYGNIPGGLSKNYHALGHTSVKAHNHTHVIIELPEAPGGTYPTNNLKISLLHYRHLSAQNSDGKIVQVKGLSYVGKSTAKFSYSNPELLSIVNKFVSQRSKWRNTPGCLLPGVNPKYCGPDSGDSNGWYAELHGANFGQGCNGNCSRNLTFYEKKLGKIRWMAERYESVGPDEPVEVYNFWEEVSSTTPDEDCTCFAKYGMKSKGSECDVCAKKCEESEASCQACQAIAVTKCSPILYWDHTKIIFYVRQGTGRDLPLQVDLGGQKNCEVSRTYPLNSRNARKKSFADRHDDASLGWCEVDFTGKCKGEVAEPTEVTCQGKWSGNECIDQINGASCTSDDQCLSSCK